MLLYQAVRRDGKKFTQRQPDGAGDWIWKLDGARRVIYRLPQVVEAVTIGQTIFITEGEKDADNLVALGLCATTNPMGAGKWNDDLAEPLHGATVVLLPDNDEPGRKHMEKVACSLLNAGAKVTCVSLPDLPVKGDVSDWLDAGGTREALEVLVAATPEYIRPPKSSRKKDDQDRGPSAASVLIEIGMDTELFCSERDEAFSRFPVGSHKETHRLRSTAFRSWLCRQYYLQREKAAGGQAQQDAINTLEGQARFGGEPKRTLAVRIAQVEDGSVWYDLADDEWRAVHVTVHGWQVVDEAPCLFRRHVASQSQVTPSAGGSILQLRDFINVRSEEDWRLLVVWIIAAFVADIPHPVLEVHGEQGSCKSTLLRFLVRLIDPSLAPLRVEPRRIEEWVQAADHSWIVALDNVSALPQWLSDAICRAVTGEGFSKRMLYTDADDILIVFRRVIALSGIEVVATRPDLLDRCILINLQPPTERQSERILWQRYEDELPGILGSVFDTVSAVLRTLPEVSMDLPRMADFARVGVAVERVLCWPVGAFMAAYGANIGEQNEEAISSSIIAEPLLAWFDQQDDEWRGTAKELLDVLSAQVGSDVASRKEWPKTPKALSGHVRRIAPNLRATGIDVTYERTRTKRLTILTRITAHNSVTNVTASTPCSNGAAHGDANLFGVTHEIGAVTQSGLPHYAPDDGSDGSDKDSGADSAWSTEASEKDVYGEEDDENPEVRI